MTVTAMEVVREEEREAETNVANGQPNVWRDPRFLIQLLLFIGAVGSFYLLSERRTTTLEIAAANMNEKATRIEASQTAIVASIQQVMNADAVQKAEIDALKESIRELKGSNGELKAHIDVLRSRTDKLDARTERMR